MGGCAVPHSPAPVATNMPRMEQPKLQAAAHWTAISAHLQRQLAQALGGAPRGPMYVQPLQRTAFSHAVATQLTTSLVQGGFTVSPSPDVPFKVEIETQVVPFTASRPQYVFSGERSALATGLWAIAEVHPTSAGLLTAAIFADDAYGWFRSGFASGATPATEIIVTVSVSDDQRYYARHTSVYYTTDSDRALYLEPPPPRAQPTRTFAVKGGV